MVVSSFRDFRSNELPYFNLNLYKINWSDQTLLKYDPDSKYSLKIFSFYFIYFFIVTPI